MLNRLKILFAGPEEPLPLPPEERLQVAAAALMVEAARMDDRLDEHERHRIAELVGWRFALNEEEAAALVDRAARSETVQWYGHTATIRALLDAPERVRLLEMLWDVVYADGTLHDLEASLMRRVGGLLGIPDAENGAARKRVLARLGL